MNLTFEAEHINDVQSVDTGGGIICDLISLRDGTLLVISDESIALYATLDDFEAANPIGSRPNAPLANAIVRHL